MSVLDQMLSRYDLDSQESLARALREVMQEIALAGLFRGGFFEKVALYGGTCLRIFHELPRFSEDLDFSLLQADAEFSLRPYFESMEREFESLGVGVDIQEKRKVSAIQSAFLKKTSSIYDLRLTGQKNIKIKFEVDTDPPLGFATESRLLLQPFSFYVRCFSLPDLFAGKMHALMYRQWRQRVKGRDWYDFEWYVRRATPLHLSHFAERARQSGDLRQKSLSSRKFRDELISHIETVDFESTKEDVRRFVIDPSALDIWSPKYFKDMVAHIQFDSTVSPVS